MRCKLARLWLVIFLLTVVNFLAPDLIGQSVWNSASSGVWSDAANWSAGVPDGAAVDAEISATGLPYGVTSDIDIELNRLTIDSVDAGLTLTGRNWTINDRIQIDNGAMQLQSSNTISGSIFNSGSIGILGANAGGNAEATIGTLTNDGMLTLDSVNAGWAAGLNGVVTNNGTFEVRTGAGGGRTFSGSMTNEGDVVVSQRFEINGGGTVWNQNSGTVVGNELMIMNLGQMNIGGGAISGDVAVFDGTINVLGTSTATGAVQAQGVTQLSGTVNDGFEITVLGSSNGGNAFGATQAGFTNQGTLTLDSINSTWAAGLDATNGFTNGIDGTLVIKAGAGGDREIFGDIVNQGNIDATERGFRQVSGTLELQGGEIFGEAKVFATTLIANGNATGDVKLQGASNTLEGTINGELSVRVRGATDGGVALTNVGASLVNQGALILDSENTSWSTTLTGNWTNDTAGVAQTLVGAGGVANFDGEITNLGALDFQATTNVVGTGIKMQGGTLTSSGRTTFDSSTFEASGGDVSGLVIVRDGVIDFQAGSTMTGLLEVRSTGTLSGTINSGATVAITGATFGGNAALNADPGAANDGTLELTSVNSSWTTTFNVVDGFTNNGLLKISQGTGGSDTINGQVDNFGQIEVESQTSFTGAGLTMKGGSITGSQLLYLNSGAAFTAEQGDIVSDVAVVDGQVLFSAGSTLTGKIEARGSTTLDGTINSGAFVSVKGAGLGGNAFLTTETGAANDGLVELDSINSTWNSTFDLTNGFTNNGTIRVRTGTGGTKAVLGDLTNTGTLDGTEQAFEFNGSLQMNDGLADGQIILTDTAITLGSNAAGVLTSQSGANTVAGTVGENMTLWINGSSNGGNALTTSVGTLNNSGRILIESSNSTWNSNFGGEVLNQATGIIEVNQGSGGSRSLAIALDNDGQFISRTNTSLGVAGAAHSNRGVLNVEAGRLDVIGDSLTNTGTIMGEGILDLNSMAFTNDGTVAPGLSPGLLTIEGDYNQSSAGILNIELAGKSPGEFDVLAIVGNANLGGTLNVDILDTLSADIGDRFRILTTTSLVSGTFDVEPSSFYWQVEYGTNYVELVTLQAIPEPGSLAVCLMVGICAVTRRRRFCD